MPIRVAGVVDRQQRLLIVVVDAAHEVLVADELLVEATLGLPAQKIRGPGQNDDESVAGVDGFRGDAGEVGCLAALHIANDESFGLVGVAALGVGEALDDPGRVEIQSGNRVLVPAALREVVDVVLPVERHAVAHDSGVPRLEVAADDDCLVRRHRHRAVEARGEIVLELERVVDARPPLDRARRRAVVPGPERVGIPVGQGQPQLGKEAITDRSRGDVVDEDRRGNERLGITLLGFEAKPPRERGRAGRFHRVQRRRVDRVQRLACAYLSHWVSSFMCSVIARTVGG